MRRLLNKFGWVIALVGVVLLLLVAVLVTFNRSNKKLSTADRLNDSVKELEKQNNKSELTNSGTSLINKSGETNVIALEANVSPPPTEEQIKILEIESNASKINPSISEGGQVSIEPGFDEDLTSNNVVKPRVNENSSEMSEIDLIPPINDSISSRSDLVSDENQKVMTVEIDIMRVDSQGETLIAGRAEPNTTVEVLSDSELIGSTQSNDQGEFVLMGTLGESSVSQTLRVRSSSNPPTKEETKKDLVSISSEPVSSDEKKESSDYLDWKLSDDIFVVLPSLVDDKSNHSLNPNSVPVIVQSSSNDIKIVQNIEQTLVSGITIDSISYSDLGEAVLVGRGNPNNKALIYLDNTLISSSDVGALGGWSTELTGLLPGIYKLRIDEVNSLGEVQSRIATPFKKESKDFLMNMVSGSITVQTGNSLWRIARRIFGQGIRYIEIYEKNNDLIKDPHLIYPGQVFSIPTENYNS